VESVGLWGLLAWVRREVQRTFFNRAATTDYNPDLNGLTYDLQGRLSTVTGDLNAVDPDGDAISFTVVDAPDHGKLVVNPDGTFTYTPEGDFARTGDQFVIAYEDQARGLSLQGFFRPGFAHKNTIAVHIPYGPVVGPVVIDTIDVGAFPLSVAISPDGGHVYTANADDDTVSVIDTATNTVVATIEVGDRPHGIAVRPDGAVAYVTNYDDWTVSVIDTATNTVTDTISVGTGAGKGADDVVFSPDGSKAYVGSSNILSVIDTATNTVTSSVTLNFGPYGIAVSPNGNKVYVASWTGDYVKAITFDDDDVPTSIVTIDVGNSPTGVTLSPNGTRLYVANADGNTVSVISTSTNNVVKTIPVGNTPTGIAFTPDGSLALVTNQFSGSVKVIDTGTMTVIRTYNIGDVTNAIVISPDGKRAYVTGRENGTVRVMNLEPLLD
jgi:YVTN family beta-propeller protein